MNSDLARYQIDMQNNYSNDNQIKKLQSKLKSEGSVKNSSAANSTNEAKIAAEAEKFTAIFLEKMFSAMKKTLPEDKMLDGGYAEDVFSDMLTKEYSQMAGQQGILGELNRALVSQLKDSNL